MTFGDRCENVINGLTGICIGIAVYADGRTLIQLSREYLKSDGSTHDATWWDSTIESHRKGCGATMTDELNQLMRGMRMHTRVEGCNIEPIPGTLEGQAAQIPNVMICRPHRIVFTDGGKELIPGVMAPIPTDEGLPQQVGVRVIDLFPSPRGIDMTPELKNPCHCCGKRETSEVRTGRRGVMNVCVPCGEAYCASNSKDECKA